jgi:DNA-binding transcriptional regulator/RsmH inhibitor MraZ
MAGATVHIDPDAEGFSGGLVRKLDDKARVVLPAGEWRTAFAEGAKLTPWKGCLALWTRRSYREVCNFMRQRVRDGELKGWVLENFREDAMDVKADTQGRLQLPEELRSRAGIDAAQGTEVLLSGQDDHIKIWAAARRAEARQGQSPEAAADAMDALGY